MPAPVELADTRTSAHAEHVHPVAETPSVRSDSSSLTPLSNSGSPEPASNGSPSDGAISSNVNGSPAASQQFPRGRRQQLRKGSGQQLPGAISAANEVARRRQSNVVRLKSKQVSLAAEMSTRPMAPKSVDEYPSDTEEPSVAAPPGPSTTAHLPPRPPRKLPPPRTERPARVTASKGPGAALRETAADEGAGAVEPSRSEASDAAATPPIPQTQVAMPASADTEDPELPTKAPKRPATDSSKKRRGSDPLLQGGASAAGVARPSTPDAGSASQLPATKRRKHQRAEGSNIARNLPSGTATTISNNVLSKSAAASSRPSTPLFGSSALTAAPRSEAPTMSTKPEFDLNNADTWNDLFQRRSTAPAKSAKQVRNPTCCLQDLVAHALSAAVCGYQVGVACPPTR